MRNSLIQRLLSAMLLIYIMILSPVAYAQEFSENATSDATEPAPIILDMTNESAEDTDTITSDLTVDEQEEILLSEPVEVGTEPMPTEETLPPEEPVEQNLSDETTEQPPQEEILPPKEIQPHNVTISGDDGTDCVDFSDPATFGTRVALDSGIYYVNENVTLCEGIYNLNASTTFSATIQINVSYSTLDCNGSILIGNDSGTGIYATTLEGITIRNCTVRGYGIGIQVGSSNYSSIIYNNASLNTEYGINLAGGSNNNVSNNAIQENGINDLEIYVDDCSSQTVQNNLGSGNRPLLFYNSPVNLQDDDDISSLTLCDADYSNIRNLTIRGSDTLYNNYLRVLNTDYTNITGLNSSFNNFGMFLESSTYNRFINNTFSFNDGAGMDATASFNNTFLGNAFFNNSYSGISVWGDSEGNNFTNTYACFNNLSADYPPDFDVRDDYEAWRTGPNSTYSNTTCDTSNYYDICVNLCTPAGETSWPLVTDSNSTSLSEWRMLGRTLDHNGYYPGTVNMTDFGVLWNYTTGGSDTRAPAVVDGVIYVGSRDVAIFALNASTGSQLWNSTIGSLVSSPAVANGIVYIVNYTKILALNASTGSQLWHYTMTDWGTASPVVANGIVYIGSRWDDYIFALNASTGSQLWNSTTGYFVSSPAVANGIVYNCGDSGIFALNASTGVEVWNHTASLGESSPAIVNGILYFGTEGSPNFFALNASTGVAIWNYTTGAMERSSPSIANGIVYFGSYDNHVYALNASNGTQVWNYTTGGQVNSTSISEGVIFVASKDGLFYVLNASTGAQLWNYTTGNCYAPAIADGIVYAGCGASVYAFKAGMAPAGDNNPDVTLYDSDYQNISGDIMMFVASNFGIYGDAKDMDGDMTNWTISLYNTSGLVNATLCFNDSGIDISDDFLCTWNTAAYCAGECENYTLVLNASDTAGHLNSTELGNITIDNEFPSVNVTSVTDIGSDWLARATISDTYLYEVYSYVLNDTNHTIEEWTHLCNDSMSMCNTSTSGTYNQTWAGSQSYVGTTKVPFYHSLSTPALEGSEEYTAGDVIGCFSEDGTAGNYSCGENCENTGPNCRQWNWWLIYNISNSDGNGTLKGISRDDWCDESGCPINDTLIQNGVSKFQLQDERYSFDNGQWTTTNTTNITLYTIGSASNKNFTRSQPDSGNYKFMFEADDYEWGSNAAEGFVITGGTPVTINEIYVTDPDRFYSPYGPNSVVHIVVNATDDVNVTSVMVDFSTINDTACGGDGILQMDYNGTTGLWEQGCDVGDYINQTFQGVVAYTLNVTATDNDSNTADQMYGPILLHNMGVPETQAECDRFVGATTNFTEELDFADINFIIELEKNLTCVGAPQGGFTKVLALNLTSVNLSSQEAANKLRNLSQAMNITIGKPLEFENSSIYINTTYFQELDTNTRVSLYELPYSSAPAIIAENASDQAGISLISWSVSYSQVPRQGGICVLQIDCPSHGIATCMADHAPYCDWTGSCVNNTGAGSCASFTNQAPCETAAPNCAWAGAGYNYVPKGNLTFDVGGFCEYGTNDNSTPTVTVLSPANSSNNTSPVVNITVNGTGTPVSQVIIKVDNTQEWVYNVTNQTSAPSNNTANCNATTYGGDIYICTVQSSALGSGAHTLNVTAYDAGAPRPGNMKFSSTNFTIMNGDSLPNMTVNIADSADPAKIGSLLNYTITYNNTGGSAHNVTINETYPANVSFITSTPLPNTSDNRSWNLLTLPGGADGSIIITVRINSSLQDGAVLTNTVTLDYLNNTNDSMPQMFDAETTTLAGDMYELDDNKTLANWITTDGVMQTHTFSPAGDDDWVKFNATANETYLIKTKNITSMTITDTYVSLYRSDDQLIEYSDDISATNRNSRFVWQAIANGTYYLEIVNASDSPNGQYNISVQKLGRLQAELVAPTAASNISKNYLFNITTKVTCSGGPCYNVTATLDPIESKTLTSDSITDSLAETGKAKVIIRLKDAEIAAGGTAGKGIQSVPPSADAKQARKDMITQQRGRFLDSIKPTSRGKGISSGGPSEDKITVKRTYSSLNSIAAEVDAEGLAQLKANPYVESITPDRKVHAMLDTSRPYINADDVSNTQVGGINVTGAGQTVCIIDTGIDWDHADFGGNATFPNGKVIGGYDFVNTDSIPNDEEGVCEAHGTHVAGIVASENETYRGIAPGAKIVMIKALTVDGADCTGYDSDVLSAIEWCTDNATAYNISVISLSLGGEPAHQDYCDQYSVEYPTAEYSSAIADANAAGITVVAASGNAALGESIRPPGIAAPACMKNVISVGATNRNSDAMYWSVPYGTDRAFTLDMLAPGVNIVSTDANSAHIAKSGTSMATPHIAGVVALMQQYANLKYNRDMTPQDIAYTMKFNGVTVSDTGDTNLTFTRVDAFDAVTSKGTVPITAGATPFFVKNTNDGAATNPIILGDMSDGQQIATNWTVNATGTTGSSFDFFTIYDSDGYNAVNTSSVNITINNIAPTISAVTIDPTPAYTNDTLNCTGTFYDNDGDTESGSTYRWFRNDTLLAGETAKTLASTNFNKTSNVTCEYTPRDGLTSGTPVNSSIGGAIQNLIPAFNPAVTNQTIAEGSQLLYDINCSDVDATEWIDTLTYYINDSSSFTINLSTGLINWTPAQIDVGTHWYNATCGDGTVNVSGFFSINVTDNRAPAITNVTNHTITASSAKVNWTTNENSNSTVRYGTTQAMTDGYNSTSGLVTSHEATLSGLTLDTPYYYNITSCDSYANCNTTGPYNFTTLDNTPPVVNLNYPSDAFTLNIPAFTFSCTAADNHLKNLSLWHNVTGWAASNTNSTPASGQATYLDSTFPDGNYIWNCQACDNTGNCAFNSTNRTLLVDTIPPRYAYNVTNQTEVNTSSQLNISAGWIETNLAGAYARLYVNGAYNASQAASAQTDFVWTAPASLAEQYVNFSIWMNDSVGNSNMTQNMTVFVRDMTGPAVQLTSPDNDSVSKEISQIFVYNVTDISIRNCSLYIDDEFNQTNSTDVPLSEDTPFNPVMVDEGEHNWTVDCYDNSDNHGETEHRYLEIDFTNPAVTVPTVNATYVTPTQDIAVTANFTDMNLNTLTIKVNGVLMSLDDGNRYRANTTALALNCAANGPCLLTFNASDTAGNYNDTLTLPLTVDSTNPAVFAPTVNDTIVTIGQSIRVIANITDTNLNTSTLRVNNRKLGQLTGDQYYNDTTPTQLGCITDSTCTLTFNATDYAGNQNITTTIDITTDSLSPSVTAPTVNDTFMRSTDIIRITANFTDANINNASMTANGAPMTPDTGDRYYTEGIPATFGCAANAPCTIRFNVTDYADHHNDTVTTPITVDSTPPKYTYNATNATQVDTGSQLNISAGWTETNFFASNATLMINGILNSSKAASSQTDFLWTAPASLAEQNVTFSIWMNDSASNSNITQNMTVFVRDTTGPTVVYLEPADAIFTNNNTVTFTYNVTDNLNSVANCTLYINGTINQTDTSVTANALNSFNPVAFLDGHYNWSVSCRDGSNNLGASATYNIDIDTRKPQYYNPTESPADPATYAAGQNYYLNITFNDTRVMDSVWIQFNGTNYSGAAYISNQSSNYQFNRTGLAAGTYNYVWYGNDSAGNMNQTSVFTYTVNPASASCILLINGAYPGVSVSYNNPVNATCSCTNPESAATLVRNGTGIADNTAIVTGAATYNYSCSTPTTQNYTGYQNETSYTVNKGTPLLSLTFNPSNDTSYGTSVTVNCSSNTPQVTPSLYRDGSGAGNPQTVTLGAATYSYICNSTAVANYTIAANASTMRVSPAADSLNLTLNGQSNTNISIVYNATTTASATSNSGTDQIWRNGSLVNEGDAIVLGAGLWNYTVNSTGNTNYSANSTGRTHYVLVNQTASSVNLLLNGADSNITVAINQTVNITGYRTAGEGNVQLYQDGAMINSGAASLTNVTTYATEGARNITVIYPATQNYSSSQETHYMIVQDVVAPALTLSYPSNNTWNTSLTQSFGYNVNDVTSGIQNCSLYIDGSVSTPANTSVVEGDNVFTRTLSAGTHTWYVKCYDNSSQNNANSSNTLTIKLDALSPTTTIQNVTNATTYSGNRTISFTTTDGSGSGVNYTTYKIGIAGTLTNYTTQFNFGTEGTTTIYYYSADNAGNLETTKNLTFTIDRTPPTMTITTPANGANLSGTAYFNVTSASASHVIFKINDTTPATTLSDDVATPFTYSLDTTAYPQGTYMLIAAAYDLMDNSNSTNVTVFIDNNAPSSAITYPATGYLTKTAVTVNGTAADTGVGVSYVEIYNGTAWTNTTFNATLGTWNYTLYQAASGTYNIKTKAVDTLGNAETPGGGINVIFDHAAPTISNVQATPNPVAPSSAVTVSVDVTDLNGVALVNATLFNATYNSTPVTLTGAGNSYSGQITTPAGEGLYNITITAIDNATNTATNSLYQISINASVATISISLANNSMFSNHTLITLNVSGSNYSWYNTTANATQVWITGGAGQFYADGNGAYTLYVWANTSAGTVTNKTYLFTIDGTSPVVYVNAVPTYTKNTTYNVTGNVTETNIGYVNVNTATATLNEGIGTSNYSRVISLTEGNNTITVTAYDDAGNNATSTGYIFLDSATPTTNYSLSGTLGDGGWYTSDVTVTLSASDGAQSSGMTTEHCEGAGCTAMTTGASHTLTTSSLVRYHSYDNAGNNESIKATSAVNIDKTNPNVINLTASTQTPTVSTSLTISATINDTNALAATQTIDIDGINHSMVHGAGDLYTYDFTPTEAKLYTATIYGKDVAGNLNSSATISFTAGVAAGDAGDTLLNNSDNDRDYTGEVDTYLQIDVNTTVLTNITLIEYTTEPDVVNTSLTNAVKYIDLNITTNVSDVIQNLTITIYYTDAEIAGLTESTLTIKVYNKNTGAWTTVSGGTVDTTNNYVTVTTDEVGLFSFSGDTTPTGGTVDNTGGGGGGGGGGGSSNTETVQINLVPGGGSTAVIIRPGTRIEFTLNGMQYTFKVDSIAQDVVALKRLSTGEILHYFRGISAGIDIDYAGKEDVTFKIQSIDINKATVLFTPKGAGISIALLPPAPRDAAAPAVTGAAEAETAPAANTSAEQTTGVAEYSPQSETKTAETTTSQTMWFLAILSVFILFILVAVLLVIRKKTPRPEQFK